MFFLSCSFLDRDVNLRPFSEPLAKVCNPDVFSWSQMCRFDIRFLPLPISRPLLSNVSLLWRRRSMCWRSAQRECRSIPRFQLPRTPWPKKRKQGVDRLMRSVPFCDLLYRSSWCASRCLDSWLSCLKENFFSFLWANQSIFWIYFYNLSNIWWFIHFIFFLHLVEEEMKLLCWGWNKFHYESKLLVLLSPYQRLCLMCELLHSRHMCFKDELRLQSELQAHVS